MSPHLTHRARYRPDFRAGFSLLEVIVVFSIISLMIGVGAVGYRNLIDSSKVGAGSSMVAAQIRQARQYAVALRESRRVVILIERLSSGSDDQDPAVDRLNPPIKVWTEKKRTESALFGTDNAVQITDAQSLTSGVTVASIYLPGTSTPRINTESGYFAKGSANDPNISDANSYYCKIYVEFNPRGQLAGVYFDRGVYQESNKADSVSGGQAFLHFIQWAERIDLGDSGGEKYYTELIEGSQLQKLTREDDGVDNIKERGKAKTIEILRLTGRVREYEYGIGLPWSTVTLDASEA